MPQDGNGILKAANQVAIYLTPPVVFFLALTADYLGGTAGALMAFGAGGAALLSAVHLRDQFRKALARQADLNEQLIQSQKLASIGQMASGIAHEINNPLAIIGQEADWMKHLISEEPIAGSALAPDLRDSLSAVLSQINRCSDITHGLLNLARKMEPVFQLADVNAIIEDMAKLVERETAKKNVKLSRDYQAGLPQVFIDPPLFRQVVLNLMTNALHAVEEGGEIRVRTWSGGEQVTVSVEDNGCGIEAENLPRIFDPFFTTKAPGKGTGLGLSLSHQIVVRMGGKIEVHSEPGKGTRFTITLPLRGGH